MSKGACEDGLVYTNAQKYAIINTVDKCFASALLNITRCVRQTCLGGSPVNTVSPHADNSKCPSGIYAITNTINGHQYIGQAQDFSVRWYNHRLTLNKGVSGCTVLQRAWKKYGENCFVFSVLEY